MPGPLGQPLDGLRIVDLTHDWAGPHATRILADFGAEVIKVEYSRRMDGMRGARKEGQAYNHHPRWHQINRNKLSVTLDLKDPVDVAAFKDLVAIADIVAESSRVGVLERLGLDYEELTRIKPEIILLSMSPFGQTGPEAGYAGYGGCLEPLSGIQSLTAYDELSAPRRIREIDVTNGILGACALMTALVYRQQTGRGQWVDLSQLEAATTGLIGEQLLNFVATGHQPRPVGNHHHSQAPWGCYRCQGEDRWIALAVRTDAEWSKLCEVIGQPELARDPRFSTTSDRLCNHDQVDEWIERWTSGRDPCEAMRILQEAGIAAGMVADAATLRQDPHLEARGFFHEAGDSSPHLYPGLPFRLSGGGGAIRRRGPHLGEHNLYVLRDLLGRSEVDIRMPSEDEVGTAYDPE
jgi:crotonobetainyl-CoA:carnitine CoA-transferase CaiB-like acyl-CoA transferase